MISTAAASAGGAPLDQLAIIGALYGGGTAALLVLIRRHRARRTHVLARAGAAAAWVFRVPAWCALPVLVAAVALLLTMGGGYWDIGYHIDYGRDDGPLGNPGHYPMLFGFFGSFAAGLLCLGLAEERDADGAWVEISRGWHVPLGGLLLVGCSAFAMMALPLDDVWHRIFGQDVTLWSPTHFMLLGGACMSVIGMCVLVTEAARARKRRIAAEPAATPPAAGTPWARIELPWRDGPLARIELLRGRELFANSGRWWGRIQRVALLGGLLVGLEAFLAEYDWGVPLYRMVWQPLLLAAFAAFVFVAARAWAGRGAALGAWGFYFVIRLAATAIPVIAGRSPSMFPLMLAAAACVELVALGLNPRVRPIAFGAAAGLLCGTAGFFAEYGWSQLVMPLPWTASLIPEALASAALAGTAGGVLGGLLAAGFRAELPRPPVARAACIGAFAVLAVVGVNAGIRSLPDANASVELTDVGGDADREALATVRLDPPDAADGANWLYLLGWQGGPGTQRVVDRLRREGRGVYRSTKPMPLHGSWKVGLRLQRGRERGAVPIRLPIDGALPGSTKPLPGSFTFKDAEDRMKASAGAELPAPSSFTRPFLDDGLIVLRETKGDVADWLWSAAIALIAGFYALFIGAICVAVARLTRRGGPAPSRAARDAPRPAGLEPAGAR